MKAYCMASRKIEIPDSNQSFWHLTCIQASAQSLLGILLGARLSDAYGAGTAMASICIGNLILWIIGLAVISMTKSTRQNAMENVISYLGKTSGVIASLILMSAFMSWYIMDINATLETVNEFFQSYPGWEGNISIRIGVSLGLLTALLAIGGIRFIRKICTYSFPFFLVFVLFMMFASHKSPIFKGTWGISITAIATATAINLPGFVNLPTFFRHARSKADAFTALSLITIFDILFEVSSIYIGETDYSSLFSWYHAEFGSIYLIFAMAFVFLAFLCLNLVNIYFASAGWEIIIPRIAGAKEYAIIGLAGTAAYTFIQTLRPMVFLENTTNNLIASLGIILLLAFLVQLVVQHRPRKLDKFVNNVCWFVGAVVAVAVLVWDPDAASRSLIAGVGASALAFVVIMYFEETRWAYRNSSIRK